MSPRIMGPAEFSAPRHRTIGELADDFLLPHPKKEVQKILKKINTDKLKTVSTWADEIKPTTHKKPTDKETRNFLQKFPDTREWHFIDLPLDASGYDAHEYAPFVRENDVVNISIECIEILIGNSTKFSKPNALRWLVHLVGDMHQPLHIACSYIDNSGSKPKLVFEKDEIISKQLLQKSDKGGNKIILPIGTKGKSLHSYWDDDLPQKDNDFDGIVYDPPPLVAINKLKNLPAEWVGETVRIAKNAYTGLTVKGKDPVHPTYIDVTWDRAKYDRRCIPIIKDQSEKAASRLAFLLNTIFA